MNRASRLFIERRRMEGLVGLLIVLTIAACQMLYASGPIDVVRMTDGLWRASTLRVDLIEHYAVTGEWLEQQQSKPTIAAPEAALAPLTDSALELVTKGWIRATANVSNPNTGRPPSLRAIVGVSGGTIFIVTALPTHERPVLRAMRPAVFDDNAPSVVWLCDDEPHGYALTITKAELDARVESNAALRGCL